MAFSDDTLSKAAFKILQGKAHTANSKDLPNEIEPTSVTLAAQEIFSSTIPFDPNDAMNQDLAQFVQLDLVVDTSSNGLAYDVTITTVAGSPLDGYVNPKTGLAYADNDRVGFFIPQKFDAQTDPAPSNSYRAILREAGVEIPPSDASNWFFDYRAGIVVSEVALGLGAGTIDGYVYVGEYLDTALGLWTSIGSDMYSNVVGNVGVGLTNPNEKFTVEGRLSLQESTTPSITSGYGKIYPKSDGRLYFQNDSGSEYDLTTAGGGGGGGDGYWSGQPATTNIYNNNAGNVGIGTATPTHELHIVNSNTGATNWINTGVIRADLTVTSDGGGSNDNATGMFLDVVSTLDASDAMYGAHTVRTSGTPILDSIGLMVYHELNSTGVANILDIGWSWSGKVAIMGDSTALPTQTGSSVGVWGDSRNYEENYGVIGGAKGGTVSNTGVWGASYGSGTTVGVYGSISTTSGTNTIPSGISAAIAADNKNATEDIFLALDNGSQVFAIEDGGNAIVGFGAANELLTVDGVLSLAQTAAPTLTAGYGKIYVKSLDNKLYYMDNAGSETDLTAGGGGGVTGSGTNNQIAIWSGTTSLDSSSLFTCDGTTFHANSAVVINEGGASVDFRVEGNTDQNMIRVDGSADRLGVGTGSPGSKLHVFQSTTGAAELRVENDNTGTAAEARLHLKASGSNSYIRSYPSTHADGAFMRIQSDTGGHIRFDTNAGTERMRLSSDGNLSISDTGIDASNDIHIRRAGDASIWLEADTNNSGEEDNPYIKMTQDNNAVKAYVGLQGSPDIGSSEETVTGALGNSLLLYTMSPSAPTAVQIATRDTATTAIVGLTMLHDSQYIGIGTNNPQSRLQLSDANTPTLRLTGLTASQDNSGTIEFAENYTDPYSFKIQHEGDDNKLHVVTSNGSTKLMTFDRDTNYVGIGHSSPTEVLDIQKDWNGSTRIRIYNPNVGGSTLSSLQMTAGANSGYVIAAPSYMRLLTSTGYMRFDTAGAENMRLTATGYLGIGETSPDAALHISTDSSGAHIESTIGGKLRLIRADTTLSVSEPVGSIEFYTTDTSNVGVAARIVGEADGTSGNVAMQIETGRASTREERFRIESAGQTIIRGSRTVASRPVAATGASLVVVGSNTTSGLAIQRFDSSFFYDVYFGVSNRLEFRYNGGGNGGYIANATLAQMNFTGQHRTLPDNNAPVNSFDGYVGYIVRSDGYFIDKVEINEALPTVSLSTSAYDKRVFGIVSDMEDPNDLQRTYQLGAWGTVTDKEPGDDRLIINSLGEGAMWVCNEAGNLENGDYITSSNIPGLGMAQDDDLLHNYTVAKITSDCDFDLNSSIYDVVEFEYNGNTYRKAFVGVTYHCG